MIARLLLVLLLAAPTAAVAQAGSVPVVVESDGQMAPCGLGRVARLNPRGDGFLAIRSGPSTRYRQNGELYNGDEIFLCQSQGDWYGIVYPAVECGLEGRVLNGPYRGPCRTGWVHGRWVDWIAG